MKAGRYELVFHVSEYGALKTSVASPVPFLDRVPGAVGFCDPAALAIMSPTGFAMVLSATYRGQLSMVYTSVAVYCKRRRTLISRVFAWWTIQYVSPKVKSGDICCYIASAINGLLFMSTMDLAQMVMVETIEALARSVKSRALTRRLLARDERGQRTRRTPDA